MLLPAHEATLHTPVHWCIHRATVATVEASLEVLPPMACVLSMMVAAV